MAFSRSVFTVLLLCVVSQASNVPVYLWGDLAAPGLKANPLMTTTSPEFSEILSDQLTENSFTVVFIEKTLSIEDFSHRNAEGKTSFPYLSGHLAKSMYLPSVENAIDALNLFEDPKKVRLTEDGLSEETLPATGKCLFIYMEDAQEGESRADLLSRHNDFMADIVSKLEKEGKSVVAVYTAPQESWVISHSRVRRQATSNSTIDYQLDGLRLRANSIKVTDGMNTVELQGLTHFNTVINSTGLTLKSTLNFPNNSIVLNFKGVGGYWFFDSVTLDPTTDNAKDLFPIEEVYAIFGFSYRCAQNITFGDANSTQHIYFEDLKVQPYFDYDVERAPVEFGDPFYCVGFFSAPIWSGLFVVFILLSITFYGIMMMMDIRTMDRFDDPKGKTITINAGE